MDDVVTPEINMYTDKSENFKDLVKPWQNTSDFLHRACNSASRYLKSYPELSVYIKTAIVDDDMQSIDDAKEMVSLAKQIYRSESDREQAPTAAVFDHLNLIKAINSIKIDAVGVNSSTDRVNLLMSILANDFVSNIPEDKAPEYLYVLDFARDKFLNSEVKIKPPSVCDWYATKIEVIKQFLINKLADYEYIDNLHSEKDTEYYDDETVKRDNELISEIFTGALKNRHYGIKYGYINQKNNQGSYIFSDTNLISSDNAFYDEYVSANSLAYVIDTPETSIRKKVVAEYGKSNRKGITTITGFNIATRGLLSINKDGSISINGNIESAEYLARNRGSYLSFRKMQAELLSDLIDLVTPADYVTEVDSASAEGQDGKMPKKERFDEVISRMLIPRIQTLIDSDNYDNILDIEDKPKRAVRLHGVVWHIRRLPTNWHASPEAMKMALEADIELGDNETFVREHQRGSKELGEIALNKLVQR